MLNNLMRTHAEKLKIEAKLLYDSGEIKNRGDWGKHFTWEEIALIFDYLATFNQD